METTPLAERMRPATLDEIVGQGHLVGPEGIIRKAIAGKILPVSYTHLTLPTSDLV